MSDSTTMFWGKSVQDWMDIYTILRFSGRNPKSFKDLLAWHPPMTPRECIDIAFDYSAAQAENYENPVPQWINDFLYSNISNVKEPPI